MDVPKASNMALLQCPELVVQSQSARIPKECENLIPTADMGCGI